MTRYRKLGEDLSVYPLALGGNVFGWTADSRASHVVLDAYVAGGGNFVDTSDSYSFWSDGNQGGESETIIGDWIAKRSDRNDLVIATKVGQHPNFQGMAAATIRTAIEGSLRRLRTDYVDIYYAHFDDPNTPLEESVAAMSALVESGKVRAIGISNYSPSRICDWLDIARRETFHLPVVLQPEYSLIQRRIESDLIPIAREQSLAIVPYYVLARGFLTGKYTSSGRVDSPRASVASSYMTPHGLRILEVLACIGEEHGVSQPTIALAWAAAKPGVVAPISSARNLQQLRPLMKHTEVELTVEQMQELDAVSTPASPA